MSNRIEDHKWSDKDIKLLVTQPYFLLFNVDPDGMPVTNFTINKSDSIRFSKYFSLTPEDLGDLQEDLNKAGIELEEARKMVGHLYKLLSGKVDHYSDCSTNNAPAILPTKCDCDR